jgi:hypothetical protein
MSWTIPYLASQMYNGIVFGPPMVCSPRHMRGRRHWGEVRPDPAFWPHHELLPLLVPSGPACVVLSGLYPCKVDYWLKSLSHPRIWVMACSPHLNTVILPSYCYLVHEMDINYLVVDEMIISKLFYHNCMLRIGCKPMILITQTWLIACWKVFKVSCCRLLYPYHWSLCMSRSLTAWSWWVSLAERSRSRFAL